MSHSLLYNYLILLERHRLMKVSRKSKCFGVTVEEAVELEQSLFCDRYKKAGVRLRRKWDTRDYKVEVIAPLWMAC